MKNTDLELLVHCEEIVWDPTVPDHEKVLSLQNLFYQWEQCRDHKTEQLWGDDDRSH